MPKDWIFPLVLIAILFAAMFSILIVVSSPALQVPTPAPILEAMGQTIPRPTATVVITTTPSPTATPTSTSTPWPLPTWTPPPTFTPGPNTGWTQSLRGVHDGSFLVALPPLEPTAGNWAMLYCKRYLANQTADVQRARISGVTWNLGPYQTLETADFHAQAEWDGQHWLLDGGTSGRVFIDLWCDIR